MATAIPGSAQSLEELRWKFIDPNGNALSEDERMRQFALKYARNFHRKYGAPPHGDHPFPTYWDVKFIIEYYGPGGSLAEVSRRFQEQTSASQA